jgi:hypothetical protein
MPVRAGAARRATFVVIDRYSALGMPRPKKETVCHGPCEGVGWVPVKKNERLYRRSTYYRKAWQAAERRSPNEPGDAWHFVKCQRCHGTGKRKKAK